MSKDLKDLIESIDSANKAHSDLETIIRYLKEEVQRLNFTIKEQKRIIQNQNAKLSSYEEPTIPEDIQILKDLVLTQREEIVKKDKDIEILTQTLEDVTSELENNIEYKEENEELIYANKVIVQLTDENENARLEIEKLEMKIQELQDTINNIQNGNFAKVNQELIDTKRLVFQLTEENGLNKVQIESLKSELAENKTSLQETNHLKNQYMTDLEFEKEKNQNLINQNQDLQVKVNFLQQKLEETKNSFETKAIINESSEGIKELNDKYLNLEEENKELVNIVETNLSMIENLKLEKSELQNKLDFLLDSDNDKNQDYINQLAKKNEELEALNHKLLKLENANKKLSDLIVELKSQEEILTQKTSPKSSLRDEEDAIPIHTTPNLFIKIYNLLDPQKKGIIEDTLIKKLFVVNREERANAIKILGIIQGPKVLKAFKKLIYDNDWIIKLYLIRALNKFNHLEATEILKELQKDNDVDVRSAADELILKIKNVN